MKSCADFYVKDAYVSVVGNKANAIVGMDGYITELYGRTEGKLLGYEIRETKKIAGVSGTYNTLWFNLKDISGITSIKIGDKTDANTSKLSTNDVYLNGGSTLFVPTYNKKLMVTTSRKYDIEMRTRYFYGKNDEGELVKYEVELPMMFIQDDNDADTNFTDYPSDVNRSNGITSSVTLSNAHLAKIRSDYASIIDTFIANKELHDSSWIKETFLGLPATGEE